MSRSRLPGLADTVRLTCTGIATELPERFVRVTVTGVQAPTEVATLVGVRVSCRATMVTPTVACGVGAEFRAAGAFTSTWVVPTPTPRILMVAELLPAGTTSDQVPAGGVAPSCSPATSTSCEMRVRVTFLARVVPTVTVTVSSVAAGLLITLGAAATVSGAMAVMVEVSEPEPRAAGRVAVIVTGPPTCSATAVKVTEVWPAGMTTEAGTETTDAAELERVMAVFVPWAVGMVRVKV